jgi:hypothetical protein
VCACSCVATTTVCYRLQVCARMGRRRGCGRCASGTVRHGAGGAAARDGGAGAWTLAVHALVRACATVSALQSEALGVRVPHCQPHSLAHVGRVLSRFPGAAAGSVLERVYPYPIMPEFTGSNSGRQVCSCAWLIATVSCGAGRTGIAPCRCEEPGVRRNGSECCPRLLPCVTRGTARCRLRHTVRPRWHRRVDCFCPCG